MVLDCFSAKAGDSEIQIVKLTSVAVDEMHLEGYYLTFHVITLDFPSLLNVKRETVVWYHFFYLLAL